VVHITCHITTTKCKNFKMIDTRHFEIPHHRAGLSISIIIRYSEIFTYINYK
jgi:hypothetical protein